MRRTGVIGALLVSLLAGAAGATDTGASADVAASPTPPAPPTPELLGYSGPETFAVPDYLADKVGFWTRVYGEWSTTQVAFHDRANLSVVYHVEDVARFEPAEGATRADKVALGRARREHLDGIEEQLIGQLKALAVAIDAIDGGTVGRARELAEFDDDARVLLAVLPAEHTGRDLRAAATEARVRYQQGLANHFRDGVVASGRYYDRMRSIFVLHGLPAELAALSFVESLFKPTVHSHAGAVGLWQFVRDTGRRFLRMDAVVDERYDPLAATDGAARALKLNYRTLRDWTLAITAYNYGRMGVVRAVRKSGARHVGDLLARFRFRRWGFASQNFYAEFLAALEVRTHYERYFGELTLEPPERFDTVEVPYYVGFGTVVASCKLERDLLERLNPALTRGVRRDQVLLPAGHALRVSPGRGAEVGRCLSEEIPRAQRHQRQRTVRTYRVVRGDSLSRIAARHRVTVGSLMAHNQLRSTVIHPGQVLHIPPRAGKVTPRKPKPKPKPTPEPTPEPEPVPEPAPTSDEESKTTVAETAEPAEGVADPPAAQPGSMEGAPSEGTPSEGAPSEGGASSSSNASAPSTE